MEMAGAVVEEGWAGRGQKDKGVVSLVCIGGFVDAHLVSALASM